MAFEMGIFGDDADIPRAPEAVIIPVTRKGKIPGRISLRQRSQRECENARGSFKSVGIAMAPADLR